MAIRLDVEAFVRRLKGTPRGAVSLRAERKRISSEIAEADRRAVLELAQALIDHGVARFVAYEIVLHHVPTLETLGPSDVMKLSRGLQH